MFFSKKCHIHDLVDVVINTLNVRDPYTFAHSTRVAYFSQLIAKKMNLPKTQIETIHIAAHLHDIGKIEVADSILNKKDILTREEYNEMKKHPLIGYDIIKKTPLLNSISKAIFYHHERWDGNGYPEGLKRNEIPLEALIITVGDAFDAITSNRTYRKAKDLQKGFDIIQDCSGSQFCPSIAKTFISLKNKILLSADSLY